jgi:hypothetical protein
MNSPSRVDLQDKQSGIIGPQRVRVGLSHRDELSWNLERRTPHPLKAGSTLPLQVEAISIHEVQQSSIGQ